MTDIRGKSKVQDQDPEGMYEALSKYARDLTQVWLAAALCMFHQGLCTWTDVYVCVLLSFIGST